jgi:SAM-dependent methyltransferase
VPIDYLDAGLAGLGVLSIGDDRRPATAYHCRRCDLIWREANLLDPTLAARLDDMVTVLPENETAWLRQRSGYFQHEFARLQQLSGRDRPSPVAYLDVGCSYGHLLDIAHRAGWQAAGIDASKRLVEWLAPRKPYPIFSALLPCDPLPFQDTSFDLITFYDSFYMMEDPVLVLDHVYEKLKPGGHLVLRLTNRNRYVRLWLRAQRWLNRLGRERQTDAIAILGDLKYSYSPRSFRRLVGLSKFQGSRVRLHVLERGKKGVSLLTRLVYLAGLFPTWLLLNRAVFSPAFIAIVRKESP